MKRVKSIFFFKLIAFFFSILFCSFVAVMVYSTQYLDQKAYGQAKNDATGALLSMHAYLKEKSMTCQRVVSMLYTSSLFQVIPASMNKDLDAMAYQESVAYAQAVDEFFSMVYSTDKDLADIALAGASGGRVKVSSRNATSLHGMLPKWIEANTAGLRNYGPSFFQSYLNNVSERSQYLLPVGCRIKAVGMVEDVGCLVLAFSCRQMDTLLQDYFESYPDSRLYVTSPDGIVYYDNGRSRIGIRFEDFEALRNGGSVPGTYTDSYFDEDLGLYFISVTPSAPIKAVLRPQKLAILALLAAALAVAMLATVLFVKHYSRRIRNLCVSMERVQAGDLSVRVPKGKGNDEIFMLSNSFNTMCDMLEEYIQQVYIAEIRSKEFSIQCKDAELKQRTAQLYALQAQINPHFLYNALESIRMRAFSCGSRDVARMAYILSSLFRRSLNAELIVSLGEEIDMCKLYLEFSILRYPNRLTVSFDTDEAVMGCGILCHMLQPMVENAINHGLDATRNDNRIEIRAYKESGNLFLEVRDNGQGIPPDKLFDLRRSLLEKRDLPSGKIGVANVHQRIQMLFGAAYGLSLESSPGCGTVTALKIPAMEEEEMKRCFVS